MKRTLWISGVFFWHCASCALALGARFADVSVIESSIAAKPQTTASLASITHDLLNDRSRGLGGRTLSCAKPPTASELPKTQVAAPDQLKPPFWQRFWPIFAYVLIAAVLAFALLWPMRARLREREMANSKLAASEQQLKMVLANSGCELWCYHVKEQVLVREGVLKNLKEQGSSDVLPASVMIAQVHPEDRERFNRTMGDHIRGKSSALEIVYRVLGSDGQYAWLRTRGQVLTRDGAGRVLTVSGITVDVTELKKNEQDLESTNAALNEQVAELMKARASITDLEGRRKLALWGSGCEFFELNLVTRMLQRENKIPGLVVNEVGDSMEQHRAQVHPDDVRPFVEAFSAYLKGGSEFFDFTYRLKHVEGHWCWVKSRGRAVGWDENGRVTLFSGTNYDVSVLKQAELELKHFTEELEQRVIERTRDLSDALGALRSTQRQLVDSEKMAALGSLVAGVAHEINTPIGIGVTAASHLGEISKHLTRRLNENNLTKSDLENFTSQSQSAVALIMSNLRRASELIKSFKQVAVDQSSEQRREVDLRTYLQDILNSLRPTLKRQKHVIEIDIPEDVRWESYPGAIYQIVSNLVLNAINHAFSDTEHAVIKISAHLRNGILTLSISDNGCGMDEDTARRVFEPFFTTKRGQGGSGLGLHIVYNLVTSVLDGSITVETNLGQGAEFVIRVPISQG